MAAINFIELYYEAAEQFAGKLGLDVTHAASESDQLKRAYGQGAAIDYSSPLRKYAYLKSLAPRHAIVWRKYAQMKSRTWTKSGAVELMNSIGAGPAPEVFGYVEGCAGSFSRLSVVCLESEPGWAEVGKIVTELYRAKTGRDVHLSYVESVAGLQRGAFTLGSLVISDLLRSDKCDAVMSAVQGALSPAKGLFLDTTKCRTPDGNEAFTSDYARPFIGHKWDFVNFRRDGMIEPMQEEVSAEEKAMSRRLEYSLDAGLLWNGYDMNF